MEAHLIFYYRKMRYNIERQRHMKEKDKSQKHWEKQTTTQLCLGDNYGVYKCKYLDW